MRPSLRERVAVALGADVTDSLPAPRGYTHAERWVVRMADGRSAFVKGAVDKDTERRLDLVFGPASDRPFTPTHIRKLALAAWERANVERREEGLPELRPIGLHELARATGAQAGAQQPKTAPLSRI